MLAVILRPHCPLLPQEIYIFIEATLQVQRCGLKYDLAFVFFSKCPYLEPPGCTHIFSWKQTLGMVLKEPNSLNEARDLSSAQIHRSHWTQTDPFRLQTLAKH